MKRPLFIAVLWGAALLPLAAHAQMRGGGGFRGGPVFRGPVAPPARFNSGFATRPMPPRMPVGRVGPVAARPMPPVRVTSPQGRGFIPRQRAFFPQGRITFNGFHNRFHHRHRFFFNTCFDSFGNPFFCNNSFFSSCFNGFGDPFRCNSPFFGPFFGGFGLPYYDPFFTSSYSQPEPQPAVVEETSHDRELALEVQELSDQIQAMRDEERRRDSAKNAPPQPATHDDGPNATLVFRDGLQLSVHNYAVVGDTVWVLDNHTTQKIPIAKLDVGATQQINDKNGAELRLPKQ